MVVSCEIWAMVMGGGLKSWWRIYGTIKCVRDETWLFKRVKKVFYLNFKCKLGCWSSKPIGKRANFENEQIRKNLCATINNQVYYNSSFKSLWVWVWIWDIVFKLYTVTGVRSHFKHHGGFFWLFMIAITCRWVPLASRVFRCYWSMLGKKVSFVREGEERKNK